MRLPHPEILHTLRAGDTLLLDDGKLRMKVLETTMDQGIYSSISCVVCVERERLLRDALLLWLRGECMQ